MVHNETSTGVTSRIAEVRRAIDRASHPALFMVDTISSLASIDYRQDEWGVDVTVAGSQKGLMLPPGLGFNALGDKALAAAKSARLPRSYWDWQPMLAANAKGVFPYTPATNLLYGLREALDMLREEGLEQVFARHDRHAEATRRAVRAWGLELLCLDPREYSSSLTAVLVPEGLDADALRALILERYDLSLGNGLGRLAGRVFRIGHLGDFNDLMLAGTLAGHRDGPDAGRLSGRRRAASPRRLPVLRRRSRQPPSGRAQPDRRGAGHDRGRRARAARSAGGAARPGLRGRRRRQEVDPVSSGRGASGRRHGAASA